MLGKILASIILTSSFAFACEIAEPNQFALSTSTSEQSLSAYSVGGVLQEIPGFRAFNCQKMALGNKFLMVAMGPQNLEFSDRVGIFNFSQDYRDSGCFIENTPFKKNQTFSERFALLKEKWKYIKSCFQIELEEEGPMALSMPEVQPGCTYERIGKQKMRFNGGFCYVKPNFGSSYIVSLRMKDECKTHEGLTKLGVTVSDFESMINFYSSGDASGQSVDLSALSSFPIRITVAPNDKLVKPSEDFGVLTPQFPANYSIPDIHLGTPEGKDVGSGRVQLRLPFWVENSCQKKCDASGQCQSACDYAQPMVGNVEYFELDPKKNGPVFLTSWYEGGVGQPAYQGELFGTGFEIPSSLIEVGKAYRFTVSFNDPKFDFERFKNRIGGRLSRFEQRIGEIGRSQIRPIPETPQIGEVEKIPFIQTIQGVNFLQDAMSSIDRAVEGLRAYLSFKLWPPYFDKICGADGVSCHGIKDDYLVLSIDIVVSKFNQEDRRYEFEVVKTIKTSKLSGNYVKEKPQMPFIKCPF